MLFFLVLQNTFLTGFKKFKTMLLGSSTGLPDSTMSHLFILYTGSQLKKGLILNSLHFALNFWMVLPLPTPQIFFTFTLLLSKSLNGSAPTYLSDLLHLYTPSWQLRSSADTRVFRIPPFRTESSGQHSFSYQAPTTWNKLPASICQFLQIFLENLSLFENSFFSPLALRCLWVSRCLFVCGCVDVCLSVCERACMYLLYVHLNFWRPNVLGLCILG